MDLHSKYWEKSKKHQQFGFEARGRLSKADYGEKGKWELHTINKCESVPLINNIIITHSIIKMIYCLPILHIYQGKQKIFNCYLNSKN